MADLRQFLSGTEKLGELKTVRNADWNLEVGAITEISGAEPNPPALLFEDIKDYPPGFRILTNMFQTQSRTALALGLPTHLRGVDLVRAVKEILKSVTPLPPVIQDTGSIQENFFTGKEANVLRFPAPKLHREDGGRYLGTADAVITRDPDAGWVNLGTARVQILDEHRVSLYISPGKQTRLIAQKYWEKGKSCPVALVCGIDPILFAVAGVGLPWGMSEYDYAGHIQKSPVNVIKGEMTGLPIPASADIVLEGEIPLPKSNRKWKVLSASGPATMPPAHARPRSFASKRFITATIRFLRSCPISKAILCPVTCFWFFAPPACGTKSSRPASPTFRGVWLAEWGMRFFQVISLKQRYGGHARQAAHIALGAREGGYLGRFVVLVDDDIDPANMADVMWAVCTRCDPQTSIEIAANCWSSPIDPRLSPEKRAAGDFTNSRAILDACRPFAWRDKFPKVHSIDPAYRDEIKAKWKEIFS